MWAAMCITMEQFCEIIWYLTGLLLMLCQHNKHVQKNQSEDFYCTRHQKQKWENKNDQIQGQRVHQKTQTTILYPNWANKASMLGLEKATTTSFTSCQIFTQSSNRNKETTLEPYLYAYTFQKTKRGKKCSRWRIKTTKKKTTTQYHYYQNRVSWRHSPWFKDPWNWIQMTALKHPGQKLMILPSFLCWFSHDLTWIYFNPNIIQKK